MELPPIRVIQESHAAIRPAAYAASPSHHHSRATSAETYHYRNSRRLSYITRYRRSCCLSYITLPTLLLPLVYHSLPTLLLPPIYHSLPALNRPSFLPISCRLSSPAAAAPWPRAPPCPALATLARPRPAPITRAVRRFAVVGHSAPACPPPPPSTPGSPLTLGVRKRPALHLVCPPHPPMPVSFMSRPFTGARKRPARHLVGTMAAPRGAITT